MSRIIKILLTVSLVILFLPFLVVNARSSDPGFNGQNINAQDYDRYSSPVRSNLIRLDSGWMILHVDDQQIVRAVYYDESYMMQRKVEITDGLPLFGGFYAGTDGFYYIVSGQNNKEESADTECFRVTKYDTDWRRIGYASLCGCNTVRPFYCGSCRMAQAGKYLLVHTCHTMYTAADGLNHQSNITFQVDTAEMTVTDFRCEVEGGSSGSVSHSMNQYVIADDDHMVTLDQGDGYPRSAVLFRYRNPVSSGTFRTGEVNADGVQLRGFAGATGTNNPNASLGGLAASSTHYLAAGSSTRQESLSQKTRNIFVAAADKENIQNKEIYWLTDMEETGVNSLAAPKLVDLKNDTYMVMWSDFGYYHSFGYPANVYWTILDHEGKQLTDIITGRGIMSDCDPAVHDNKVIWYTCYLNAVTFHVIDLSTQTLTMFQAKTPDWTEVTDIIVDSTDVYISLGETYDMWPEPEPQDADDAAIYYKSMDPSIAFCDGTDRIKAVSVGKTVIRLFTANGVYRDIDFTVVPKTDDITFGTLNTVMNTGETQIWTVTVSPEEAQPYLRYISSDPSVISISPDGVLTALKPGTAKVTACVSDIGPSRKYAITVKGRPAPESVSLDRTSLEMATETDTKLTAAVRPSGADQTVTWTSSDDNIARVDSAGKVTALRYGTVTITAASKADHSLTASCTIQTRFYDVNDSSKYYYKPVYWAADNGITTGYDRVYFGPQQNCTRRELSIFLWRLAGKPAASGSLPFSDTGKYAKTTDSYKAILWCYTNGIVKGYSDGTFKPDNPIVRKDTMIMLYRLAGKPAVSGTLKFPDARALGYGPETDTYRAIVWGTQLEITKGYSDGSFKPLANCLREHIVTFVYRFDSASSVSLQKRNHFSRM